MTERTDLFDLEIHDEAPTYYFGYGVGPQDFPSLEAVKTWAVDGERNFDTLTIAEFGTFDAAAVMETELETVMNGQGLESAMHIAEALAVAGGYLDPDRADGRLFTRDDAPPDPFTTIRDAELTPPQYRIGAITANGNAFLDVTKEWGAESYERLVVPQPDWDTARDVALSANDLIDRGDLQTAMHRVELAGMAAGVIDPDRDDPRLFTQGPPDPFQTLAEQMSGEINPFWQVEPEEIAPESPDWQFDMLPAHTPDGDLLGHALHMATPDEDNVKLLEVAHFNTIEDAQNFTEEFVGFVLPGVLEAPELAEEVARIEGHSTDWQTITPDDLDALRTGEVHLVRDPADWRVYDPHAERDTRIEVEGLNTPPTLDFDL